MNVLVAVYVRERASVCNIQPDAVYLVGTIMLSFVQLTTCISTSSCAFLSMLMHEHKTKCCQLGSFFIGYVIVPKGNAAYRISFRKGNIFIKRLTFVTVNCCNHQKTSRLKIVGDCHCPQKVVRDNFDSNEIYD